MADPLSAGADQVTHAAWEVDSGVAADGGAGAVARVESRMHRGKERGRDQGVGARTRRISHRTGRR